MIDASPLLYTWVPAFGPFVGKLIRLKEDEGLQHLDIVETVADHAGQTHLPDFL